MLEIEKIKKPSTKEKESEVLEKEPSPELLEIQNKLQQLKDKEFYKTNPEEYKELSRQTYKDLGTFFLNNGAEFVTDVNDIYKEYKDSYSNPLVVRREDPEKVTELAEGMNLDLRFDPKVSRDRGDKYANCAIWPYGKNPVAGIKNAFLEGRGMAGPIVALTGINPNKEKTELDKPENAQLKVGDIEREAVRIFSGEVSKEDLRFIILRIQKNFFPEENLTEEEKKTESKQIFRGFEFEQ